MKLKTITTLSVQLTHREEAFVEDFIEIGRAKNKVQVIKKALKLLEEEEAVQSILRAQKEVPIEGDLRELTKRFK